MVFLWRRKVGNHEDWYLRKTARVNGKVKVVLNLYLGTPEQILARHLTRKNAPASFSLCSFSFGTMAAILAADEDLGFSSIVRNVVGAQSSALAFLAYLAGRSEEPLSKNAMPEWFDRSWLRAMKPNMPSLSCRSYLRHMDKLTDERIRDITFRLAKRMVDLGFRPSLVFFDPTNFSTEQQPDYDDPDRQMARCGHPKDGNFQAKLVGLALATTEEHLPVFHDVYPGNENDVTVFQNVVGSMVNHLLNLGMKSDDLVFVFDKGNNSEDGLTALVDFKVHFVCSLKRNQVANLLNRPLTSYQKIHRTEKGEHILGFREKKIVMGVSKSRQSCLRDKYTNTVLQRGPTHGPTDLSTVEGEEYRHTVIQ